MGIPVKDLAPGSVVRLVSGSPKFVVERVEAPNRIVLLGWCDRLGFVQRTVHPDLLTWPRREETPAPDAPAEASE